MRIDSLRAHNFMVHRALVLDVPHSARCVLICGPNGSGKTSVLEGIRLAMLGEFPDRGIAYKKDLPRLITEGEKDGFVEAVVNGVPYKLSLKTGNHGGNSPPAMPAQLQGAIDPVRFIELEPAKRRKILFDAAGISIKVSEVEKRLVKEGHQPMHVERLRSAMAAGLEAGAEQARRLASEARGGWKAVTNEEYGSTKAATWEAKVPDAPEGSVDELKAAYEAAQAEYSQKSAELDALKAAAAASQRRASLEAKAGTLATLQQRAEIQAQEVARLEAVTQTDHVGECPGCGLELCLTPAGLEESTGEAVDVDKARKDLVRAKEALAQTNVELAGARAAELALGQLAPTPQAADLEVATRQATIAGTSLDLARDDYDRGRRAVEAAATARQSTEKAARFYADAVAFTALEKAVADLPATYLDAALTKFNGRLATFSAAALDSVVQLRPDMTLTYRGFAYPQLSRSQQTRVQLAVAVALAFDGGVAMVDEFDLIEPAHRGAILKTLGNPEHTGAAQVIVAATLKQQPTLPDGYAVSWLGKE